MKTKTDQKHIPVLLDEVLDTFAYLTKRKEPVFVDGTIGLAGHSIALAVNLKSQISNLKTIGIDKDEKAIKESKLRIKKEGLINNFVFVNDDFNNYEKILKQVQDDLRKSVQDDLRKSVQDDLRKSVQDDGLINIDPSTSLEAGNVDGIFLDLGVSSMQLDEKKRGFSFQDSNQPLDMRMNQNQVLSAATIINNYSLLELKRVLKYAEEKYYRKIAENICQARKVRKIRTVGDLLKVLEDSIPAGVRARSKKHFATNTFRGLRIETNNELSNLADTIKTMVKSLKPGSKIAVISFHSTEDRIVKHAFKELANPCTCPRQFPQCICGKTAEVKILTKKPILPNVEETGVNPRARSAKLRIGQKNTGS